MPATHFQMMEFEEYDPSKGAPSLTNEEMTLRMWAERLDKVHGKLPIKALVDCAYEWTKEHMEEAKENDSEADEVMVKRVAYYGINVSVPFIVMRHWDEWQHNGTLSIDDTDLSLCWLAMNIQYACQIHFFARYWDHYFDCINKSFTPVEKRHTTLMRQRYALLPETFQTDDIIMLCGVGKRNAEKMIERWLMEHYIERIEHGRYRKLFLFLI